MALELNKMLDYSTIKNILQEKSSELTHIYNSAAKLLADCINKKIIKIHPYDSDSFFSDFGNTSEESILSKLQMKDNGNNVELTYTAYLRKVLRPSIFFGSNKKYANVFWLINDGYSVKKNVWFKHINNFGQRATQHYVERGIKEFNSINSYGMKIREEDVIRPLLYFGRGMR